MADIRNALSNLLYDNGNSGNPVHRLFLNPSPSTGTDSILISNLPGRALKRIPVSPFLILSRSASMDDEHNVNNVNR